jgi:hypothetical protein
MRATKLTRFSFTDMRVVDVRLKRQSNPQSPANYSNLVRQQKECGNQRDRDGQRVASEEVQGHGRPAGASGYQRPTN